MSSVSQALNTSDLLDEMMGPGGAASSTLSPAELQRLESLRLNQEKSAVIVRAVAELLIEKGYATAKDISNRVKL